MQQAPVLIAGAGPGGLSLALDLGKRGIPCMVVERRTKPTDHPRATLLGPRSMEYFRRHGLADLILDAGIPTCHRYEVRFVTRLSGRLLYHYASPSPNEYRAMHANQRTPSHDSAWSPYFKVQVGQHVLEPILADAIRAYPHVDLRYGWELTHFGQGADGVSATLENVQTKQRHEVRAAYLAACDGGRSIVRETLGIPYTGRGAMRRNISILFRSPELGEFASTGRANLYFIFTPGSFGVVTNIDGRGLWNYSCYLMGGLTEQGISPDQKIREVMGRPFPFEVLRTMGWSHHQSVADKFRRGRVFLLGDAAHLFSPTGGIGMNTAIGDAFDLGWKLSATLQGWGGPRLLDSYELERRPVSVRNTQTAADNGDRIDSIMQTIPPSIDADSEEADVLRAELEPRFKWVSKLFNSMGAHLGARYADSPIIVPDGSPEPPDDPRIVVQSTWPGARAPHAWTAPGRSTLDAFDGAGFTLITTGDKQLDTVPFTAAAAGLGIPLGTVHHGDADITALHERPYVLVRPDGHVCWRGDHPPADPSAVMRRVAGHG